MRQSETPQTKAFTFFSHFVIPFRLFHYPLLVHIRKSFTYIRSTTSDLNRWYIPVQYAERSWTDETCRQSPAWKQQSCKKCKIEA